MGDDEKVKAWRWPSMWFRQESFWRDVGSRTLAAVFAAGIIYVFALAAGYVTRPDIIRVVAVAAVLVLIGVVIPSVLQRILTNTSSKWVAAGSLIMAVVLVVGVVNLLQLLGVE